MTDWTKIEPYLARLTPQRIREIRDADAAPGGLASGLGREIARYLKRKKR
jgi:hypothetical protein